VSDPPYRLYHRDCSSFLVMLVLISIQVLPSIELIKKTGCRLTKRFSMAEIRARWQAILYDPLTAATCIARLADLEWDIPPERLSSSTSSSSLVPFDHSSARSSATDDQSRTTQSESDVLSHSHRTWPRFNTISSELLSGLRFSVMEEQLLKDTPYSHMDFFSRISRKQAYCHEAERLEERILELETELKMISEKKLKMLALLRGHHLRYEMKSKEILLGRTTGESVVDVDLAEEGDASKVSRKQALIKLKRDGEFYIHNIGRATLFINGRPVPTGKRRTLSHCCLVEVRQIAFIFEINRALHEKIKSSICA